MLSISRILPLLLVLITGLAAAEDPPEGFDRQAWLSYCMAPLEAESPDYTEAQSRILAAQVAVRPEVDRILHRLTTEVDERSALLLQAEHDAWELHHQARARFEASPQHGTALATIVHGLSLVESYCERVAQLQSWYDEVLEDAPEE